MVVGCSLHSARCYLFLYALARRAINNFAINRSKISSTDGCYALSRGLSIVGNRCQANRRQVEHLASNRTAHDTGSRVAGASYLWDAMGSVCGFLAIEISIANLTTASLE